MKVILIDMNIDIVNAWKEIIPDQFKGIEFEILQGDIVSFSKERGHQFAIVSPANSFGIMDGGVDRAISKLIFKNEPVEQRIRLEATKRFGFAFTPVGQAVSVFNPKFKYYSALISAPTMQYPMKINRTLNAYISTYAALKEFDRLSDLVQDGEEKEIVFTAMGGLTGGYTPKQVAVQMWGAFVQYRSMDPNFKTDWKSANSSLNWLLHPYD